MQTHLCYRIIIYSAELPSHSRLSKQTHVHLGWAALGNLSSLRLFQPKRISSTTPQQDADKSHERCQSCLLPEIASVKLQSACNSRLGGVVFAQSPLRLPELERGAGRVHVRWISLWRCGWRCISLPGTASIGCRSGWIRIHSFT